jgi:MinD-like ATPase involved in chromosome partitioning or flagellar assembly
MEMKKRYVDIVDADIVYVTRLQRYIRTDPLWRDRIVLRGASSVGSLHPLLEERVPDLLLASPQWIEEAGQLGLPCPVAELADRPDSAIGERCIVKYQPVPELLERMMSFSLTAGGSRVKPNARREPSSRIVAVYSPAGGSGKSTLCLHLMRVWQREGLRVIYVNLETLVSEALFGSGDWEQRSARFIYMLEHQPAQFRGRWREAVVRHGEFGFDMLPPIMHLRDGMQMSEQAAARCISSVKESGEYDMILVDLDSGCNERIAGVFRSADDIVWLESGDAVGADKSRRMLSGLSQLWREDGETILRKIIHVRNRVLAGSASAAGHPAHAVSSASGEVRSAVPAKDALLKTGSQSASTAVSTTIAVDSPPELPYIPEWKQVRSWTAIWKHDAYNDAVVRLHRRIWAGSP